MRFPGRDWLFVLTVALLAVPVQVTLIPVLRLLREAGLSGQFLAVWLVGTGYALPFCILLMRNAMAELPREVLESAAIDGAGPARILRSIALPMTLPALGALAIFQFLFVWNDLLVTLVILGPSNPSNLPLTVVIANLSNSIGGDWQYLMAAAFLSAALPLAIFFVFQRAFVRGMTAGAIKG
jgi:alpha-glucoside transport system permease protein